MFTQCPQCNAIFQVTASQLKAAGGDVRCGQCLSVFNALQNLSEKVPHTTQTDASDELAQDAQQYRNGSAETPAANTQDPTPTEAPVTPPTQTVVDDDVDVFSEVVAEVSSNKIPAAELERFEKFLATERLPDEAVTADENSASAKTAVSAEDVTPTEEPLQASVPFFQEDLPATDAPPSMDDTWRAEPNETALSIDEALPDDNASQTTDSAANRTPGNNAIESFLTDETPLTTADETSLGDIETATADLNTEISIDDDEFAELDAFLNGPDAAPADKLAKPTVPTESDDNAIIINDTDLEPMTSAAYTDSPATPAEPPTDVPAEDTAGAAQESAQPPTDEPQTINIPTLILDDLQAAKAEQLRPSNAPWIIGSLVLMLSLIGQVVYFDRDELAKDASLRPGLIQMCELLGCTLSQPYDIAKIEIIGRDVRSHPTARNALVVSTTLINNASFVQPFPLLTMTFSDINGTKIAQRRFTPREYLHNDTDLAAGMTPDMPVRVELELVDPGKAAVNYEFRAEVDPRRTRPLT